MSGQRPWQTGVYVNSDPAQGILKQTVTINRHFLSQGYQVFGGGKIYHGFGSEGREDTWSEWAGRFTTRGGEKHNLNGLGLAHFDWGPLNNQPRDMGDAKLTDWAIDKLQHASSDSPMFLAVGYVKPHLPWHVPQVYFDRFPLETIRLPEVMQSDLADVPNAGRKMAKPQGDHAAVVEAGQWKHAVQGYLATVSFLDDQVGRLLKGLEESPRADRMIVVWWTDHGWHLGEKEHWRKFALWEDATRTSFAVAAPGVTSNHGRCEAPVDYTAVYPTLCELAGLPKPAHVQGPSLMPLLRDPTADWKHVAICTHGRGNHAVIDERFRYIRYADQSEELYDHRTDRQEWHNLVGRASSDEVISRLRTHLPSDSDELPPTGKTRQRAAKNKKKSP